MYLPLTTSPHCILIDFFLQVCDATFYSEHRLIDHQAVHSNERPFLCDREGCGKAFKRKRHFLRHVAVVHDKISSGLICHQCGKGFSCKTDLEGHVRQVHTLERPFLCTVCGKGFAKKCILGTHMKSHGIDIWERKHKTHHQTNNN